MSQQGVQSKEVVLSYIQALHGQRYEEAVGFLHDNVKIKGPGGESFGKPLDFIEMLRTYRGRYDIRKVFVDEEDVCVLYDFATTGPMVYMSSWYKVKDGKIVSIVTVFDPRAFGPPPGKNSGGSG
jgi:SnoaL-like domain